MSCSWLRAVVMLGFGLLSGCGASPPTRFYILNDIAPTAQPAAVSNRTAVRVEPPALAPELDRPELVTRSGNWACHLRRLGVDDGTLVGICLERSVDLPVIVLAVLEAGGVCVPLEPSDPAPRVMSLCANSEA